jgi:hypothetical protein
MSELLFTLAFALLVTHELDARLTLAAFCGVHTGLHARLSGAKDEMFHAPLSIALIFGCAAVAAIYVGLRLL